MRLKDIIREDVGLNDDQQLELDVKIQDVGHGLYAIRQDLLKTVGRDSPMFLKVDTMLKTLINLQKEWKAQQPTIR